MYVISILVAFVCESALFVRKRRIHSLQKLGILQSDKTRSIVYKNEEMSRPFLLQNE